MSPETAVQFLGRLHPLVLHAPIGLLVALAALEFFGLIRRRPLPADIRTPLIWLVALSSIASAASGLALAREQSPSDTLQLHQWLGIAVGVATLIAALLQLRGRAVAYALFLLISLGLVVPAGHLGASMTHGANFLTEPFTQAKSPLVSSPIPTAMPTDPHFTATVLPIFEARCSSCHGPKRQKAGLALHTLDAVHRGSKQGPVIDNLNPAASELLVRIKLPLDDDYHMPPQEKPQLTPEQIAAIEAWVMTAAQAGQSTEAAPAAAATLETPSPATALPSPAPLDALAALAAALIHVAPVSEGSPLLVIDTAAAAGGTTDDSLARLLSPIKPNIADLSLARSRITDASAPLLASLPNLRRLNLTSTGITDATLAALSGHSTLEELILARTKTSDTASLASIPNLKRLYVWHTQAAPESLAALAAQRPDLVIDYGAAAADPVVEAETTIKFTGDLPPPGAPPAPSPSPASLTPSNTTCPVSGAAVNPDRVILYKEKLIAFCCEKCAAEFWLNAEKYADRVK